MKDLEQSAQDYANGVIECNPDAENAKGLIATAVVYGANHLFHDLDVMDFGNAIKALKLGKKVRRKKWDSVGVFLWLKPATNVKAEWCKDPMLKALAEQNGGEIPACDTICMFTAQHTILTGWIPQQSDMFAEDWEIVK